MSCPQSIPQTYEITIKGHLPQDWEDWFEGITIYTHPEEDKLFVLARKS